jgi:type IV secretion system protein VirB9
MSISTNLKVSAIFCCLATAVVGDDGATLDKDLLGSIVSSPIDAPAGQPGLTEGSEQTGDVTDNSETASDNAETKPPLTSPAVKKPLVPDQSSTSTVIETDTAAQPSVKVMQAPALSSVQPAAPTQEELSAKAADVWMDRTSHVGVGTNASIVHTFDGSIARIVCQHTLICTVALEEGEMLTEQPLLSDPVRWQVSLPMRSELDGTMIQQYIALKPTPDADLATLTVFTDRRVYPIVIVPSRESHTFLLSYDYPDSRAQKNEERLAQQRANAAAQKAQRRRQQAAALETRGVSTSTGFVVADRLEFYSISGTAKFRPLRVYSDGRKTYIDLPMDYLGELPTVEATKGNVNATINARFIPKKHQIVVDAALESFSLLEGRQRVKIKK